MNPLAFTLDATAACAEIDPELFFSTPMALQTAQAKAICFGCELRRACMEYAIEHRLFGVWGGTTEEQRSAMGARPRPVPDTGLRPCGTAAAARRHERRGEPLCEPCRLARNRTAAERKAQQHAFLTGTDLASTA